MNPPSVPSFSNCFQEEATITRLVSQVGPSKEVRFLDKADLIKRDDIAGGGTSTGSGDIPLPGPHTLLANVEANDLEVRGNVIAVRVEVGDQILCPYCGLTPVEALGFPNFVHVPRDNNPRYSRTAAIIERSWVIIVCTYNVQYYFESPERQVAAISQVRSSRGLFVYITDSLSPGDLDGGPAMVLGLGRG